MEVLDTCIANACALPWANHRRLDHRELFMALDLLHQSAGGNAAQAYQDIYRLPGWIAIDMVAFLF
jgi:hypothetical protein